jgi:hypothetical protein
MLTRPLNDYYRLIEKIDTVIKEYLINRFTIKPNVFLQQSIDTILDNITLNPDHYRYEQVPSVATHLDTMWSAAVVGVVAKKSVELMSAGSQYVVSTVRAMAKNNGQHRVGLLKWLQQERCLLDACLSRYGRQDSSESIASLREILTYETKAFFQLMSRLFRTLSDEASQFEELHNNKKFHISGFKDNESELGKLLQAHILTLPEFQQTNLLHKLEADLHAAQENVDAVERQNEMQLQLKRQQQERDSRSRKLVEELTQKNSSLRQELESAHTQVGKLQADLYKSRTRGDKLDDELRNKIQHEKMSMQRIQQLVKEKSQLEALGKKLDQQSNQGIQFQVQVEQVRSNLVEAEKCLLIVQAEKQALEQTLQHEQLQQSVLEQQLVEAHAEEELLESAPELDDFVARLSAVLHTKHIVEEREFPIFKRPVKSGCTSAQLHVMAGRLDFLADMLADNPFEVNAICSDNTSKDGIGKKSLLELALFHSAQVSHVDRKTLVELIIQNRPFITAKTSCLVAIVNRLQVEPVHKELRTLFCQYAISQKTCLQEARNSLRHIMQQIEMMYEALKVTHLARLLKEIEKPIEYCRLLSEGYLHGNFDLITNALNNEKPIVDAEAYEIIWDLGQKREADLKNVNSLRLKLEASVSASVAMCLMLKPPSASIAGKVKDPVIMMDDAMQSMCGAMQVSTVSAAPVVKPNADHDVLIRQYSDLVDCVSRVISRFGVVLNTKGFNQFQRSEIELQIRLERDSEPDLTLRM